jgi:hypothetical protein
MKNLMIRNFKNGIRMIGAARATIDGLFGECFENFIDITANYDVVRINNIHINFPFWSSHESVVRYLGANSVGIVFGRVDNPVWSNLFIFYARIGLKFYNDQSPIGTGHEGGMVQRLQITNLGIDLCNIGVYASDSLRLSIANFYVFCRNDPTEPFNNESRCFYSLILNGANFGPVSFNFTNGDFQGSALEALRFDVPGIINLSNVIIRDYNLLGTGAPAISVNTGVKVFAANVSAENPNTGPLYQTFGTGSYNDANSGAGGGGTSGVSTFNNRTGNVTLTGADLAAAIAVGRNLFSSNGTLRSLDKTIPSAGTGLEITYDPAFSAGFVTSYDRTNNVYKDLSISGRNVTFQSGAGLNAGSFDTGGRLLLGYSTSVGGYKLQVDGEVFASGAMYALTPPSNTTGTRVATCDYVISKMGGGGGGGAVSSFNGRTGAITLNSTDVNTAYGASPTFSGYPANQTSIEAFGTVRSTYASIPSSGTGVELSYNSALAVGFVTSYDRSANQYRDLGIAGRNITFQSGAGANVGSFDANGSLLIGYPSTNGSGYKLQVNSQIYATSASIATSDRRVKENITSLKSGLKEVMKLKPVTYTFVEHEVHNFPKGTQVGFIAQDIEKLLAKEGYMEGIVASNDDGLKGLAEVKLVPLLVKALQELNDKFEAYVKLHP